MHIFQYNTGVVPITFKYHVSWSRVFWRHDTEEDAIICFCYTPRAKIDAPSSQYYASKQWFSHKMTVAIRRGSPEKLSASLPVSIARRWASDSGKGPAKRLLHKWFGSDLFMYVSWPTGVRDNVPIFSYNRVKLGCFSWLCTCKPKMIIAISLRQNLRLLVTLFELRPHILIISTW